MKVFPAYRRWTSTLMFLCVFIVPVASAQSPPTNEPQRTERVRLEFQNAYRQKDWPQAIELGLRLNELAPRNSIHQYNLACVYSLNGQPEEATTWLAKAAVGGFSRIRLFETDSDLKNVRGHPGYKAAVARVKNNHELILADLKAEFEQTVIHIFTPPDYDEAKPVPLIIALHGYGGTSDWIAEQWRNVAAAAGALLVAPRAVHPGPGGGFSWMGEDRMSADEADYLVQLTFEFAMRKYNIDREHVVLTGFSQGGFVALAVGPRKPYRFTGVIPMAGGYIRALDAPPKATGDRPPRFYFMVGQHDRPVEQLRQATDDFTAAGYETRLRIYPKVGHTFPIDRDAELRRALDFVLGPQR